MTDERYAALRRPVLEKAGVDSRSIDYLLRLERGTAEACVASLRDLSRTPAWEGRLAEIPGAGLQLRYTQGAWRISSSRDPADPGG